jgi:hypothetical protein
MLMPSMPSMISMISMISFALSFALFQAPAFSQAPSSGEAPATGTASRVVQEQDGQATDEMRPGKPDRMLRGNHRSENGEKTSVRSGFMDGSRGRESGRGGIGRRPMTEADIETMIEIADSISPKWASELRAKMADDPEKAQQAIMKSGRRLFGLVMLKEKKPQLFATRVAELRVQFDIRRAHEQYQLALKAGDAAAIMGYKTTLTALAAEIVDLELKARAMELAALDQAVQEMRVRLQSEIEDSAERITGMIERLLKPVSEATTDSESVEENPSDARPGRPARNDASSNAG